MANLGEVSELINSDKITLEVGLDNYILLNDLDIHIGRTENRQPTTDGGVLYTYGKSDSWFTANFTSSQPEIDDFNTSTQPDSNGDMLSTAWKIVGENVSGGTITFQATGILRDYEFHKGQDGVASTVDIFVRITGNTTTIVLT